MKEGGKRVRVRKGDVRVEAEVGVLAVCQALCCEVEKQRIENCCALTQLLMVYCGGGGEGRQGWGKRPPDQQFLSRVYQAMCCLHTKC